MHQDASNRIMTTGRWLLAALALAIGATSIVLSLRGILSFFLSGGVLIAILGVWLASFILPDLLPALWRTAKSVWRTWRMDREHAAWLGSERAREEQARSARKGLFGPDR